MIIVDSKQNFFMEFLLTCFTLMLAVLFKSNLLFVAVSISIIISIYFAKSIMKREFNLQELENYALIGFLLWMVVGVFMYAFANKYGFYAANVEYVAGINIALGFCSMLLGFIVSRIQKRVLFPKLNSYFPYKFYFWWGVGLTIISFPQKILNNNLVGKMLYLPIHLRVLEMLDVPAFIILCYFLAIRNHYSRRYMAVLYVCLTLLILSSLIDTSRRNFGTILFGGLFLLMIWRSRFAVQSKSKLMKRQIKLGLIVLVTFYLIATSIRAVSWSGGTLRGFTEDFIVAGSTARNLRTFNDYAFVIANYPLNYRFLYGSSFVAGIATLVPRGLWHSKPISFSKEMAFRKFGYATDIRYTRSMEELIVNSSISATLIGEAHANLGIVGVFIILFLFGYTTSLFSQFYKRHHINPLYTMIYSAAIFAILVQHRGDAVAANYYLLDTIFFVSLPYLLVRITRKT